VNDGRLRNRLVGALVLVCLAVIFIPMILTGEGSLDIAPRGPVIPPEPDYKFPESVVSKSLPPPTPAPETEVTVVEAEPADVQTDDVAPLRTDETSAAVETNPPPEVGARLAAKGVPAWAVQVGSFSNQNSALRLRDELRARKFAAYVEAVKTKDTTLYRVRVGPELQEALAQALRERVAKETGHDGIVVSHH
jgi:DedD protein